MSTKIYCIYSNDNQIEEYNLKETDTLKLFNANDLNIKGDNINNLNNFFGEGCAYYYIWKNQIKSDLVGFCHYRRHFNKIYYNYIDNNHVQSFHTSFAGFGDFENNKSNKLLYEYLRIYYNDLYKKIKFDDNGCYSYLTGLKTMYIMTWEVFEEVCKFIFGFYDFISKKIHKDWKTNIFDIYKYLDMHDCYYYWKISAAVHNEFYVGLFLSLKYEVKDFINDINNLIVYNTNNKQNLFKVYKKNLITGNKIIFNVSNLEFTNEELTKHRLLNVSYDKNELMYHRYDYILLNIKDVNINDFLSHIKLLGKNPILLNDNEYIESEVLLNCQTYKIKVIES